MLWVSGKEYLITKLHVIRNIMEARFLYLAASRNIRTAIVLVANTHAKVSQTRTVQAQMREMDFPCGFSPISPVKTTK
jgi:hypothetical protein